MWNPRRHSPAQTGYPDPVINEVVSTDEAKPKPRRSRPARLFDVLRERNAIPVIILGRQHSIDGKNKDGHCDSANYNHGPAGEKQSRFPGYSSSRIADLSVQGFHFLRPLKKRDPDRPKRSIFHDPIFSRHVCASSQHGWIGRQRRIEHHPEAMVAWGTPLDRVERAADEDYSQANGFHNTGMPLPAEFSVRKNNDRFPRCMRNHERSGRPPILARAAIGDALQILTKGARTTVSGPCRAERTLSLLPTATGKGEGR